MNHQHAKIWSFLEWNDKTTSNIRNKHFIKFQAVHFLFHYT